MCDFRVRKAMSFFSFEFCQTCYLVDICLCLCMCVEACCLCLNMSAHVHAEARAEHHVFLFLCLIALKWKLLFSAKLAVSKFSVTVFASQCWGYTYSCVQFSIWVLWIWIRSSCSFCPLRHLLSLSPSYLVYFMKVEHDSMFFFK